MPALWVQVASCPLATGAKMALAERTQVVATAHRLARHRGDGSHRLDVGGGQTVESRPHPCSESHRDRIHVICAGAA